MSLAKFSIDRPVFILMFYLAIVLLGMVSFSQLSVDLLPSISYPRLSVVTQYAGVAPEEVEALVTMPLETSVSRGSRPAPGRVYFEGRLFLYLY